MNAINWKKLLLPNIPYLLFVYLFDKVGQAVRLAPSRIRYLSGISSRSCLLHRQSAG